MFRVIVKDTDYPLHSTVSPSIPLPCVTLCHHISTAFYNCQFPIHLPSPLNTNPCTTTLTLYSSQHLLFVSHTYISVFCNPQIVCLFSGQYPTRVYLTDSWYHLLRLFPPKQWRNQESFRRGCSTKSVEDRGQREGGRGLSSLVRCSGCSCNLVREISFYVVIVGVNNWMGWIGGWMSEWMRWIRGWMCERLGCICGRMSNWMGWIRGWVSEWMGWIIGRIYEWMNGVNKFMNEWMNGVKN